MLDFWADSSWWLIPLRKTTYLFLCFGCWVKTSSLLDSYYFHCVITHDLIFFPETLSGSDESQLSCKTTKQSISSSPKQRIDEALWGLAAGPELFGAKTTKLHLPRRQAPPLWPRLRSLTAFGGAGTSAGGRSTAGTGGHMTRWTSE